MSLKHGMCKSPEYTAWLNLKRRCTDPNHPSWKDYGGRGITVCDAWLASFAAFLGDVGQRPSPLHTIDRLDNDKGYEPGNCAWRTRREQQRNRRAVKLTFAIVAEMRAARDSGISIAELARRYQVHYNTAFCALKVAP